MKPPKDLDGKSAVVSGDGAVIFVGRMESMVNIEDVVYEKYAFAAETECDGYATCVCAGLMEYFTSFEYHTERTVSEVEGCSEAYHSEFGTKFMMPPVGGLKIGIAHVHRNSYGSRLVMPQECVFVWGTTVSTRIRECWSYHVVGVPIMIMMTHDGKGRVTKSVSVQTDTCPGDTEGTRGCTEDQVCSVYECGVCASRALVLSPTGVTLGSSAGVVDPEYDTSMGSMGAVECTQESDTTRTAFVVALPEGQFSSDHTTSKDGCAAFVCVSTVSQCGENNDICRVLLAPDADGACTVAAPDSDCESETSLIGADSTVHPQPNVPDTIDCEIVVAVVACSGVHCKTVLKCSARPVRTVLAGVHDELAHIGGLPASDDRGCAAVQVLRPEESSSAQETQCGATSDVSEDYESFQPCLEERPRQVSASVACDNVCVYGMLYVAAVTEGDPLLLSPVVSVADVPGFCNATGPASGCNCTPMLVQEEVEVVCRLVACLTVECSYTCIAECDVLDVECASDCDALVGDVECSCLCVSGSTSEDMVSESGVTVPSLSLKIEHVSVVFVSLGGHQGDPVFPGDAHSLMSEPAVCACNCILVAAFQESAMSNVAEDRTDCASVQVSLVSVGLADTSDCVVQSSGGSELGEADGVSELYADCNCFPDDTLTVVVKFEVRLSSSTSACQGEVVCCTSLMVLTALVCLPVECVRLHTSVRLDSGSNGKECTVADLSVCVEACCPVDDDMSDCTCGETTGPPGESPGTLFEQTEESCLEDGQCCPYEGTKKPEGEAQDVTDKTTGGQGGLQGGFQGGLTLYLLADFCQPFPPLQNQIGDGTRL